LCPQLSFFVKRWCADAAAQYSGYGLDDNAYKANSFGYVAV